MDAVEGRRVVSRERVVWLDDVEEVLCVRVLDKWDALTVGLINDNLLQRTRNTSDNITSHSMHLSTYKCENLQVFLTVD
jgi:hypothetical protein